MKQLQRLTMTAALVLAVTMSAFAGEIPITKAVSPPPPPSSATSTNPGEIPITVAEETEATTQLFTDLTMELLQTLLSVY
jgi:hypothetical protein